jgi:hypothetical protein
LSLVSHNIIIQKVESRKPGIEILKKHESLMKINHDGPIL